MLYTRWRSRGVVGRPCRVQAGPGGTERDPARWLAQLALTAVRHRAAREQHLARVCVSRLEKAVLRELEKGRGIRTRSARRRGGDRTVQRIMKRAAARLAPADRERFASGDLVVLNPGLANDAERYGQCAAYHPPAYVNGELASDLELLAHIPGVADARRQIIWQDLYLFRKPASADSPPGL